MPYFTTVEFRVAMADMNNEAKYPDGEVERARDFVEALIERFCGTSFIARTVTDTLDGDGSCGLVLTSPYVQTVTSVTVDGVLQTGYTNSARYGILERATTGSYVSTYWPCGFRNVLVVYEAGYSTTPPLDLKDAAMQATRDRVMALAPNSAVSKRATSINTETGNVQFSLAGADRPTGLPEVDAVIIGWRDKVSGPGVA